MLSDQHWMKHALQLAEYAQSVGEVPIGAVLVKDKKLIAEGWNQPISSSDPTAHAEIVALRNAAKQMQNYRLPGSTLYVTLEPCKMCSGALVHARVERLVIGALAQHPEHNHKFEVTSGIMHEACGHLLQQFFKTRR